MKKKQASLLATAAPVLLVLAGTAVVRGENVFTDDFKGDGDQARFVIEAEHYSSRGGSSSEGWWEVDGGSHRFTEGPGKGKDAPAADKLRAGEDAAGGDAAGKDTTGKEDTTDKKAESSGTRAPPRNLIRRTSIDLTALKRPARGNYKARGNYMLVAGDSEFSVDPTGSSYEGAFMDYRVAAQTPGMYRLHARWFGLDGNHDSFYAFLIGPDGTVPKGAGPKYFAFHQYGAGWRWDSRGKEDTPHASLAGMPETPIWRITKPGEYTIRLAQRERHTALDALVFQTVDLPSPGAEKLAESKIVDKPAENKQILAIRVRLLEALQQRRKALQSVDEALARETLLQEALESLLASGDHGDLSRWNVTEAKQKVGHMIQTEQRSKEALVKAIEQLEVALTALGGTPPPPPQPVAHWNFDDGEGTSAGDSAGDNNGTVHGAKWTKGKFGGALSFDGVDDYVEVADDPSLRFMRSSSFTISAWVMPAPDGASGFILSKMRAARRVADVRFDRSSGVSVKRETSGLIRSGGIGGGRQIGVFGYRMSWGSATSAFAFTADCSHRGFIGAGTGRDSAPAGRWHHVAAVYSDRDIRVYLNGELKDRKEFILYTGSTTPDKNLVIGALSYDSIIRAFFAGKIDEVCIYDGALPGTEIKALYKRGPER